MERDPPENVPPGGERGADPVDLATGTFVMDKVDLALPDVIPLVLARTYRTGDDGVRPFGVGGQHPYDLWFDNQGANFESDLILPDGGRIHYVPISQGPGPKEVVLEHTATPTVFYGSRVTFNGTGWDLTLTDGTTYVFGIEAPLQQIRDRFGNTVTITRTGSATGNIAKITSPHGRYLEFTYDTFDRITQAKDNIGRTVSYTYGTAGRLETVTDARGGVTTYTYDGAHRLLTIEDPRQTDVTNPRGLRDVSCRNPWPSQGLRAVHHRAARSGTACRSCRLTTGALGPSISINREPLARSLRVPTGLSGFVRFPPDSRPGSPRRVWVSARSTYSARERAGLAVSVFRRNPPVQTFRLPIVALQAVAGQHGRYSQDRRRPAAPPLLHLIAEPRGNRQLRCSSSHIKGMAAADATAFVGKDATRSCRCCHRPNTPPRMAPDRCSTSFVALAREVSAFFLRKRASRPRHNRGGSALSAPLAFA